MVLWNLIQQISFYISNEENLELQIGDFVEISYNGEIMESYPAQLGEVL